MKVEIEHDFKPVKLVLETQEEVDKVYSLLNHLDLAECLDIVGIFEILQPYRSKDYTKYHEKLQELLRK